MNAKANTASGLAVSSVPGRFDHYAISVATAHSLCIDEFFAAHLNDMDVTDFQHLDELYPQQAALLLRASHHQHWPCGSIDAVLEAVLSAWLLKRGDLPAYAQRLFAAINAQDCMKGVLARLNVLALAKPDFDDISIQFKTQTVSAHSTQQYRVPPKLTQQRLSEFLNAQDALLTNLDDAYSQIRHLRRSYLPEQTLLSWIGSLVLLTAMRQNLKLLTNAVPYKSLSTSS